MRVLALLFLFLFSAFAQATSFDCAKARTLQEKTICTDPKLSAADDQMAAAYHKLLNAIPTETRPEIREEQIAWLRFRPLRCSTAPRTSPAPMSDCLAMLYRERTHDLENSLTVTDRTTILWHFLVLTEPDGDEADPEMSKTELAPGYGTLQATWPEALSTAPQWQAWNTAIEKATQLMSGELTISPNEKKDHWSAAAVQDIDIWVSLDSVHGELVTASIGTLTDFHGAHPSHGAMEFNWLLADRRELKPEDVFRGDSQWAERLQNLCDRDLHRKLDSDGESYEEWGPNGEMQNTLRKIVTSVQNWTINGNGITIVWQPYAVACYACTPEPTRISWASLRDILNPGFPIPADAHAPVR